MAESTTQSEHSVDVEEMVEQREKIQERLSDEKERVSQHGKQEGFIKEAKATKGGSAIQFTVETNNGTFEHQLNILSDNTGVVKSKKARAFEKNLDADIEKPDSFVGKRVFVRYQEHFPRYIVPPTDVAEALILRNILTVKNNGSISVSNRVGNVLLTLNVLSLVVIITSLAVFGIITGALSVLFPLIAVALPLLIVRIIDRRNTYDYY